MPLKANNLFPQKYTYYQFLQSVKKMSLRCYTNINQKENELNSHPNFIYFYDPLLMKIFNIIPTFIDVKYVFTFKCSEWYEKRNLGKVFEIQPAFNIITVKWDLQIQFLKLWEGNKLEVYCFSGELYSRIFHAEFDMFSNLSKVSRLKRNINLSIFQMDPNMKLPGLQTFFITSLLVIA